MQVRILIDRCRGSLSSTLQTAEKSISSNVAFSQRTLCRRLPSSAKAVSHNELLKAIVGMMIRRNLEVPGAMLKVIETKPINQRQWYNGCDPKWTQLVANTRYPVRSLHAWHDMPGCKQSIGAFQPEDDRGFTNGNFDPFDGRSERLPRGTIDREKFEHPKMSQDSVWVPRI
ncbi:hypothetical protein AXG93_1528s1110 [Marchantia polymorpha subsp. ruderalis]|uniref:Uncharacterized protein n=1 Tax=Marchantia polymorpha subsp. ruderalis TaxID=1480154 RepID=A0A176VV62_MARPO|nr:hypothetical protein AXG93_1528s1110 [Marchantia polymorpha subsp. ruderalis]